jgi:flavoprotein
MSQVLYAVLCAAPPTHHVRDLITAAHTRDFDLCLITTPTAGQWLADDLSELEGTTGHPVRSTYKKPTDPDVLPPADAMLVAPATFNTINKWAAGISDTLALGLINEAIGLPIPILTVPYLNDALSAHPALPVSLRTLKQAGVDVMRLNPKPEPHAFAWGTALDQLRQRLPYDGTPPGKPGDAR